jgi:hypothetical protein
MCRLGFGVDQFLAKALDEFCRQQISAGLAGD